MLKVFPPKSYFADVDFSFNDDSAENLPKLKKYTRLPNKFWNLFFSDFHVFNDLWTGRLQFWEPCWKVFASFLKISAQKPERIKWKFVTSFLLKTSSEKVESSLHNFADNFSEKLGKTFVWCPKLTKNHELFYKKGQKIYSGNSECSFGKPSIFFSFSKVLFWKGPKIKRN